VDDRLAAPETEKPSSDDDSAGNDQSPKLPEQTIKVQGPQEGALPLSQVETQSQISTVRIGAIGALSKAHGLDITADQKLGM